MFAGEAYNVEMGVTNELFPISKTEDETCNLGAEPNDVTRVDGDKFDDPRELMADWMMFSLFTRFLDAPQPAALTATALQTEGLESPSELLPFWAKSPVEQVVAMQVGLETSTSMVTWVLFGP